MSTVSTVSTEQPARVPVVHDGGVLVGPRDGGEGALDELAATRPKGCELLVDLHLANLCTLPTVQVVIKLVANTVRFYGFRFIVVVYEENT